MNRWTPRVMILAALLTIMFVSVGIATVFSDYVRPYKLLVCGIGVFVSVAYARFWLLEVHRR